MLPGCGLQVGARSIALPVEYNRPLRVSSRPFGTSAESKRFVEDRRRLRRLMRRRTSPLLPSSPPGVLPQCATRSAATQGEALGNRPNQGLRRPTWFFSFSLRFALAFGEFPSKFGIQKTRQRGGVQGELGDAALVVDRHGCTRRIGHGALDVVGMEMLMPNRRRGCWRRLLDRVPGEARIKEALGRATRRCWPKP